MPVAYWRVGMKIPCSNCSKEIQVTLSQPESFWYETTYTEFIRVLTRLHDYEGVQRFLSDTFQIVKIDLAQNSAVRRDGDLLTLPELHESIQQNSEWQNTLYHRRMDTDR